MISVTEDMRMSKPSDLIQGPLDLHAVRLKEA
jgi:hypothetical protein